jgi:hypothetical protein
MAVEIAKKFRFHRHFGILSVNGYLIFYAGNGKRRKYDEFVVSSWIAVILARSASSGQALARIHTSCTFAYLGCILCRL